MMLRIGARVVRRRWSEPTDRLRRRTCHEVLVARGGSACGLVVGVLALPVSAVAGETCQGEAATVVGSPEVMTLLGTDGDDVIVTNGSWAIFADDGNDRVCVTGNPGLVYAGFGDDVVDSTAS